MAILARGGYLRGYSGWVVQSVILFKLHSSNPRVSQSLRLCLPLGFIHQLAFLASYTSRMLSLLLILQKLCVTTLGIPYNNCFYSCNGGGLIRMPVQYLSHATCAWLNFACVWTSDVRYLETADPSNTMGQCFCG